MSALLKLPCMARVHLTPSKNEETVTAPTLEAAVTACLETAWEDSFEALSHQPIFFWEGYGNVGFTRFLGSLTPYRKLGMDYGIYLLSLIDGTQQYWYVECRRVEEGEPQATVDLHVRKVLLDSKAVADSKHSDSPLGDIIFEEQ